MCAVVEFSGTTVGANPEVFATDAQPLDGTASVQYGLPPAARTTAAPRSRWDIGPHTGGGAAVGRKTGLPVARLPVVDGEHDGETENGEVLVAVSDHHGGYYVGGAFSMIGGVVRRDLAHVKADGSVDRSWNT